METVSAKSKVIQKNGGVYIELPGGQSLNVTNNGTTAVIGRGWTPLFAVCLSTFIFLELRHQNGERASWILNGDGERIAGRAAELGSNLQKALLEACSRMIADYYAVVSNDPPFSGNSAVLLDVSAPLKAELLKLWLQAPGNAPKVIHIDTLDDLSVESQQGTMLTVPTTAVRTSISTRIEDRYLAACRGKGISWPSPVDSHDVTEVHGLLIWHLMIAWRCVDRKSGLLFYVIAAGFGEAAASLYLPSANTLIVKSPTAQTDINVASYPFVDSIADHLYRYHATIPGYLSKPVTEVAHFLWPVPAAHLGHYLFNELAGLEKIVRDLDSAHYPVIYDLSGAAGSDFYGPLRELFPELAGHIVQDFSVYGPMLTHCYAKGKAPLRFGSSYVSADLRRRIVERLAPSLAAIRTANSIDATHPILVFGLRVENRTLVDPAGFYTGLATLLASRFGRITVILDGHNKRDGADENSTFTSHMENQASRRPVDVEHNVAAAIEAAMTGKPVTVVNCVGMTMLENLSWMSIAHYCVAPWGAGLAKYRWILNLPSYVLGSLQCQRYKADMDIYHSPQIMDGPSELVMVPGQYVTDLPDAETLLPKPAANAAFYQNFDVAVEPVALEIGNKLSSLALLAETPAV